MLSFIWDAEQAEQMLVHGESVCEPFIFTCEMPNHNAELSQNSYNFH